MEALAQGAATRPRRMRGFRDSPIYPTDPVARFSLAVIGASAFGITILLGAPVLAQAAAPAKPASQETLDDLTLAAAVNSCALAVDSKVPMQNAVFSNAQAITYVVVSRYGSQIGTNPKLQPQQILDGAIVQTIARVKGGCYAKLNANDKKFIDDVMTQFEKQVKAQGQNK